MNWKRYAAACGIAELFDGEVPIAVQPFFDKRFSEKGHGSAAYVLAVRRRPHKYQETWCADHGVRTR